MSRLSQVPFAVRRRVVAAFAIVGVMAVVFPAFASADRAFTVRYATNDTGNITMAANSLMTCPTSASGCAAAQSAASTNTVSDNNLNNNNWAMTYIDTDAVGTTFDSSSSTLALPAGSSVLFAGLYWGGDWSGSGANAAPNASARNTVQFKAPGAAAYSPITASVLDDSALNVGRYQGFADVTSRVQAAGVGSYSVANVQAGQGSDHYAGWSLVVVYRDTAQPARNLSVFDGLVTIRASDPPTTIPVSGFQTPPAGAVKTTLGFITYEGDLGIVGDTASLNSTVLTDAKNPATNFFNSSTATNGTSNTSRNPSFNNQLGYDADFINADGVLPNGATSANIKVTTSGDQYLPGVITFATELYAPRINQTKTVVDLNGGNVEPGDTLEYRITGTNTGQDDAVNFTLRDPIPNGTSYVPSSMNIVNGAGGPAGTLTDAAGDDRGDLDTSVVGHRVVIRAGSGANATVGGRIAVGASYDLRFRVTVNGGLPTGTSIDNTATANFFSASLNTPLTAVSSASSTVKSPDLTIAKTHTGAIVPGGSATYNIIVSNVGAAASQGIVTVSDDLPAALTATSATGSGWTCSIVLQHVSCTRSDSLVQGGAYPVIHLAVTIDPSATGTIGNTATVSGGGDSNPANNSSSDPAPASPSADLSVKKTVPAGPYVAGDTITYTLLVKNNGPSNSIATGVSSFDALPAGFTLISAVPSQGTCTAAVTCDLGSLVSGATATVTVKVLATSQSAGKRLDNTAVVSSDVTDPDPSNNTDTASVDVGAIDLAVTKTVTPASPSAGGSLDYTVGLTNLGPSGATHVVLRDALPPELETTPAPVATVTSGAATCTVTATEVICNAPTLAAGASITVHIVGQVRATATGTITNIASASAAEHDSDSSNDTATADANIVASADLQVTKTASVDPIISGNNVIYTIVTTNNGPAAALNAAMTDVLPNAVTFVSTDDPANCTHAGQTVSCSYGTLANGDSRTVHATVTVDPSQTVTFRNDATVSSTTPDGTPGNNTSGVDSHVTPRADVSIVKTSDHATYQGGDLVTWTLVAHNGGPSTAQNVTVDDDIPATLDFVSVTPGAPTCSQVAGHVHCDLASLAPGADRTVTIVTRAQGAPTSGGDTTTYKITVSKQEQYWSLAPGETRTMDISCPDGIAADGTLQIVDVDSGHGTPVDVQVQQASSISLSTYRFIAKNTSSGQAQVRPQITCLPSTTDADTTVHPLVVGALQTQNTGSLTPGRYTFTIPVDAAHHAIAPGIEVLSGLASLVGSEPVAGGWQFTVDVQQTANVNLSLRLLSNSTGGKPFSFLHIMRTVTIGPGRTNQLRVSCPVGYKGIVGTYDLPAGVFSLGSVPEPINRDFDLYNTNDHSVVVTLDLECIGIETTMAAADHRTVTNTATVGTTTTDTNGANNSSSASIAVDSAAGSHVAIPAHIATTPVAPAGPAVLRLSRITLASSGSLATMPVRCAGPGTCAGTVKLSIALPSSRAHSAKVRRVVIGTAGYWVNAGSTGSVKVKIARKYRSLIRSGRIRSVQVTTAAGSVAVKAARSRR